MYYNIDMIICTFEDKGAGQLRHVTTGAIIVNQERNKILLAKRSSKILNGGKYCLPGGFLSRNETTVQCVLREVKEETGYQGKIISLFRINSNPVRPQEDRQNVDFAYIVEAQEKSDNHDWENTEIKWFNISNLPKPEEFAFDHFETIELYIKYLKQPFTLPIVE